MRELNLLETGCLGGLLLLSLVSPLRLGGLLPLAPAVRKRCLRTVWTGQILGAFAGLMILVSAPLTLAATAFGVMTCLGGAWLLGGQARCA